MRSSRAASPGSSGYTGGATDLYTVDPTGKFTFTPVARYDVPKATSGALVMDGNNVTAINITLDKPLGSQYVNADTIASFGYPRASMP